VLISLIFGDKLNSNRVEFGLDGGLSLSDLYGMPVSKSKSSFNLGFYFDFKMKDTTWIFHTGVMVKSTMGAKGIPVYSVGDPELDDIFVNGSITRRLNYFNVPFMMKYKFNRRWFAEAGPMVSLFYKGKDEFIASVADDDDLIHTVNINDNIHKLDFGLIGGVGYRLMKGHGLNLGVRYYFGVVDVEIDDSQPDVFNRSFYAYLGIPIGISKKKTKSDKTK